MTGATEATPESLVGIETVKSTLRKSIDTERKIAARALRKLAEDAANEAERMETDEPILTTDLLSQYTAIYSKSLTRLTVFGESLSGVEWLERTIREALAKQQRL